MKKTLLLLTLLVPILSHAQRNSYWSGDTLKIDYHLESLSIISIQNSDESSISLPGFVPTIDNTKPQLLHRSETFAVPEGYEVSAVKFHVLECDTIDVKIAPSSFGQGLPVYEETGIVAYSGTWPLNPVKIGKTQVYRGNKIGRVHIYPAAYDYQNERLYFFKEFQAQVIIRPTEISVFRAKANSRNFSDIRHMLSLPESMDGIMESQDIEQAGTYGITLPVNPYKECPRYLIVTPDFLKPAAEQLAKWKSCIGYSVCIESVSDSSSKSPEQIKELIKEWYDTGGYEYVLILGDGNLIKPFPGTYNNLNNGEPYYTDYFYACLDDFDYYDFYEEEADNLQDVYLGRIPVSTLEEANAVVAKIINYQKNPPESDRYYENTILFSEYDVRNHKEIPATDKIKDYSYFIEASYQIYEGLKNNNFYDRSYNPKDYYVAPKGTTPTYFGSGKVMPEYLKNYNWATTPNKMIQEWNKGVYLIGVLGHGNVYGWLNNGFRGTDISKLKATSELPIVFSFNCYSGAFYHPNYLPDSVSICKKLLAKADGGIVSCIGANGLSWSPCNSYYYAGLYDVMYPGSVSMFKLSTNPTFVPYAPIPTYQLGKVMERGRQRMMECFEDNPTYSGYWEANIEVNHILGDPSINIYHGKPLRMNPQFTKTSAGYSLTDPRKLILKSKLSNASSFIEGNYGLSLSEVIDYAQKYDLYLVGDDMYRTYVPEQITLGQLTQLENGGMIKNVAINNNDAEISVDSVSEDIKVCAYDIYGNITDSANLSSDKKATLTLPSGINILTIESNGCILDSKRVIVK